MVLGFTFSHNFYTLYMYSMYFVAPAWESRKWILIGTWYVWWLCFVEQRYLLWAATTLGAEQTLSWMGHLGECKVRNIYLRPHSNLSMKSIIRSFWHQDQECQTLAILFIGGLDLEFLFNQNLKFHLALMKLQDGSGIQTASSLFSMGSLNSEKSWFTCFASQEMFVIIKCLCFLHDFWKGTICVRFRVFACEAWKGSSFCAHQAAKLCHWEHSWTHFSSWGTSMCLWQKVHIGLLKLRSLCFPCIRWAVVCLVVSWYMSLDQIRLNGTDVTHIAHFMFCGGFHCMSNTMSP